MRLKKILSFSLISLFPSIALAEEVVSTNNGDFVSAALAISAGLGIAIAAIGGALAQGKVAAAAMEGIARNPEATNKIQTPLIISLALIESLVIYALVVAFLLQGKI